MLPSNESEKERLSRQHPVTYRARMRNHNTIGEAVRQRRLELGVSQDAIAAQAEVSGTTWRKLENGDPSTRRDAITRRMETALGWPVGAFARIEAGEDPAVLVGEDADPALYARLTERLDAQDVRMERIESLLRDALSHLPAPKRGRVGRR